MNNYVIPMWKPVDWTSFDVVKKIRAQNIFVKIVCSLLLSLYASRGGIGPLLEA